MRHFGCRIKWDTNRGRELWIAGVKVREIATELNTTYSSVMGAAIRWNWPPRVKPESETPKAGTLTRRCPGCLARYQSTLADRVPHCTKTPTPLLGVAA
jgi:hypothetical protein